jgi:rare lipoprotein A
VYRTALTLALLLSTAAACEAESGLASYYGGRGHRGEMTCAHRTRPFVRGRVIDVSVSAARALGMMRSGVVLVSVD